MLKCNEMLFLNNFAFADFFDTFYSVIKMPIMLKNANSPVCGSQTEKTLSFC